MKFLVILIAVTVVFIRADAQNEKDRYLSVAFLNIQNAAPFGKFAGMFSEILHPGIEAGYGKNISIRQHDEWFLELKIAYFYHRFVQHAIPVYVNFGYRYKVSNHFSALTSLGVGYMQSIPAAAKLKLNNNGDYVKNKGVGRMQAVGTYSLGIRYTPKPNASKPVTIFTAYQQMLQMPFVKSYVPLLPYNAFLIGLERPLKSK